jgi:hypothetical protein
MATITSANATLLLGVQSIYPVAQQIQEFAVDDAFAVDRTPTTEVKVGVDGYGVAGYVPRSPKMTIRLLASSPSFVLFENWILGQDQVQDVLYGNVIITLPSIGRKYTCYMGALMDVSTLADAKKVLEDREFTIQWLPQGTIPAISAAPM